VEGGITRQWLNRRWDDFIEQPRVEGSNVQSHTLRSCLINCKTAHLDGAIVVDGGYDRARLSSKPRLCKEKTKVGACEVGLLPIFEVGPKIWSGLRLT
jgi:hypothetical protein